MVLGDGVGEAELLGQGAAGVGEDGKGQAVLADHEIALAGGLRADGGEKRAGFAEGRVEVAPGLELRDAVGAPAAAKEVEDEWPEGKKIGRADGAAGGVREGEFGGDGADGEDFVFDAGGEELGDGALADGHALRLDEVARVLGDLVELVLEGGHGVSSLLFRGFVIASGICTFVRHEEQPQILRFAQDDKSRNSFARHD